MSKRFVFIGFHHRINDPRLFHRQAQALHEFDDSLELYFMTRSQIHRVYPDDPLSTITEREDKNSANPGTIGVLKHLWIARELRPTAIQASDARELHWALLYSLFSGAKVFYDSHEDYFNQIFEYSGKKLRSLVLAFLVSFAEVLLVRFFDGVFCTDEYLYKKYSQRIYSAKNLRLVRNFPPIRVVSSTVGYSNKASLDIVYVGGVNQYRGVIQCAEYVARFNEEHGGRRNLTLTVYSPTNDIVRNLVNQKLIIHHPWIDYAYLMEILPRFDVGICLWLRLKKFERNLPLKNFDYMAAGLPIITSNFGNLQKYARKSGAALCIDPLDYNEFEQAICALFNSSLRKSLGESGRCFITTEASFDVEAGKYVTMVIDTPMRSDRLQEPE